MDPEDSIGQSLAELLGLRTSPDCGPDGTARLSAEARKCFNHSGSRSKRRQWRRWCELESGSRSGVGSQPLPLPSPRRGGYDCSLLLAAPIGSLAACVPSIPTDHGHPLRSRWGFQVDSTMRMSLWKGRVTESRQARRWETRGSPPTCSTIRRPHTGLTDSPGRPSSEGRSPTLDQQQPS
jgi:hypothetical protein